jgi:hypothetical protein
VQGAVNLHFFFNSLQPVLTLRQGKESTAVMPANFEDNIIPAQDPEENKYATMLQFTPGRVG